MSRSAGPAKRPSTCSPPHRITPLYVEESDRELRGALTGRGFLELPTDPCAHLTLDPPSFDGYKRSLSKSRRDGLARERRQIADAGITIDVIPLSEALIEELAPLQERHHGKHGVDFSAEKSREMHVLLLANFGADMQVVTARSADGVLRGVTTLHPPW